MGSFDFYFLISLYDLTEYTVSGREQLRIKVIWKWRVKMLCAGKVKEAVSAWLEHFAQVFFSVSQEMFNQNPQNVPSPMKEQAGQF